MPKWLGWNHFAEPNQHILTSILICRDHILNTGEDAVRISCLHEKARLNYALTINIVIFVASIRCGCTLSSIWALGKCTPWLSNFQRHGVPLCSCNTHSFRAWWHCAITWNKMSIKSFIWTLWFASINQTRRYYVHTLSVRYQQTSFIWKAIENPKGSLRSQRQCSCKAINNSCLLRSLLELGEALDLGWVSMWPIESIHPTSTTNGLPKI
jgi:hypothetical protein